MSAPVVLFLSGVSIVVGPGLIGWLLWQSWVEAGDGALAELDDEGSAS